MYRQSSSSTSSSVTTAAPLASNTHNQAQTNIRSKQPTTVSRHHSNSPQPHLFKAPQSRSTSTVPPRAPPPPPPAAPPPPHQYESTSISTNVNKRQSTPKLSMAQLINKHRSQTSTTTTRVVPERDLLRDIVYILQGVDGEFIRFKPQTSTRQPQHRDNEPTSLNDNNQHQPWTTGIEFMLKGTNYIIHEPTQHLLHTLSEIGWLYKQINNRIEMFENSSNHNKIKKFHHDKRRNEFVDQQHRQQQQQQQQIGTIEQSLYACLKNELTEYYRLVAILQGQLNVVDDNHDLPLDRNTIDGIGNQMTLKRLVVWTEDVKLRMRMMSSIITTTGQEQNIQGGKLLTLIHSYVSNGNPFISNFNSTLLKQISKPFFKILNCWIWFGELRDPFNEFFVQLNSSSSSSTLLLNFETIKSGQVLGQTGDISVQDNEEESNERQTIKAHELWENKFSFRRDMLPSFLEESFGRKIFSTGKSLNFIKHSCGDTTWVSEQSVTDAKQTLQYDDMVGLERSITLAYSAASQKLFDMFLNKFRLMDHLAGLKDFLLLGKGDFIETLMENLGPSLDRPANLLYRHNLTATLETALRHSMTTSTSTLFDQNDVVRRLDARMLEFNQGEIGWDVFTLEYKVDSPLDTVLDPKSMLGYQRMFKHLWFIKRVEYNLNLIQRRLITSSKNLFKKLKNLNQDFHSTRLSLQQMLFFVKQFQYYCHLEVIGCSWQSFEQFVSKRSGDLDSLIEAHQTYLERLISKALLLNGRKSSKRDAVPLLDQIRQIFRIMLQYRTAADSLCSFALAEASRQETLRDVGRGIDSPIPSTGFQSTSDQQQQELEGIRQRLEEYSTDFKTMSINLITQLGQAPDLDARFLSVRLNYNYHFINTNTIKA
ncbi:Microtubule-nucleating Tub4p (gamma-tubulin) complex component [Microbotryomycetes sp. JL221]|nr:Microtubule-nucleating Tub4p (gamma-tubulin) complex component [Microbotryomycetes sp. JL221]